MQEIIGYTKKCGELLYQNREQEAYQILQKLVGILNTVFQKVLTKKSVEEQEKILGIMKEFISAYQLKDNLALADLLYCEIPELLK